MLYVNHIGGMVLSFASMGIGAQPASATRPVRAASVLFPPEIVARVARNADREPWAAKVRQQIVKAAGPWLEMSDDDLWGLMFGLIDESVPVAVVVGGGGIGSEALLGAVGQPIPIGVRHQAQGR